MSLHHPHEGSLDGPLPNKVETERAILGAVLVDESVLRVAEQHLSASDFFVPAHRRIFAEMQLLAKNGQPVELVTLCDALQQDPEIIAAGGAAFVASLATGVYRNAPIEAWAKGVLEASVLRKTAFGGELLMKRALEPGACIENLAVQAAALQKTLAHRPTQAGGFELTPLADLLARPDVPVDYVVENLFVAGTVACIVAKPKVGKSTFARNLCLSVSRGVDFLGLKTKRGECIYLALEEREEDLKNDFRSMGADGSEAIYVHAASAPADGIDAACDLVRQRRPAAVVIDPLFRLARIRDEKAYGETYAALGPLIDVAREVGTLVVLVHHAGKSTKADAVDSPLGSTAIGGAVCTVVLLKKQIESGTRTLQTVQRIGQDMPETVLRFDLASRSLSLGARKDEADVQALAEKMTEYLQGVDEAKEEPEIMAEVEGKLGPKRKALRALVAQQKVTKEGAGKKGNPYKYTFSFPRSQDIAGTRERESQNGAEPCVNIVEMLVPERSQKPILVPGCRRDVCSKAEVGPGKSDYR